MDIQSPPASSSLPVHANTKKQLFAESSLASQSVVPGAQLSTSANLEKFLNTYNKFMVENPNVELNPQTVIADICSNILQPPVFSKAHCLIKMEQQDPQGDEPSRKSPKSDFESSSESLQALYRKGQLLMSELNPKEEYLPEMVSKIKKLKEEKIFETIGWIEQLNHKLNREYQHEVNRGIANGIYSQKGRGAGGTTGTTVGTEKSLIPGLNEGMSLNPNSNISKSGIGTMGSLQTSHVTNPSTKSSNDAKKQFLQ